MSPQKLIRVLLFKLSRYDQHSSHTGSSAVQLAAQNNKDTLKMRKRSRDAGYRIEGTVAPGYESVKRMFKENFVSGTDER